MFNSRKLRRWVRDYFEPRLRDGWEITEIGTFTAEKTGNVWEIYVKVQNRVDSDWTNGFCKFRNGTYLGGMNRDCWKRKDLLEDRFDQLTKHLGLRYVPSYSVEIPSRFEKIKKKSKK